MANENMIIIGMCGLSHCTFATLLQWGVYGLRVGPLIDSGFQVHEV